MKLHYKGKYDLNPESLPHGEHKPGAVKFKEAENSKRAGTLSNEEIEVFYKNFSPMLNPIQRKKLRSIVDDLKKI